MRNFTTSMVVDLLCIRCGLLVEAVCEFAGSWWIKNSTTPTFTQPFLNFSLAFSTNQTTIFSSVNSAFYTIPTQPINKTRFLKKGSK